MHYIDSLSPSLPLPPLSIGSDCLSLSLSLSLSSLVLPCVARNAAKIVRISRARLTVRQWIQLERGHLCHRMEHLKEEAFVWPDLDNGSNAEQNDINTASLGFSIDTECLVKMKAIFEFKNEPTLTSDPHI